MLKFEKIHEDKRGEIYLITGLFPEDKELTLFITKRGFARGGCIHRENIEYCCVLEGTIEYYIGILDRKYVLSKGDKTFIDVGEQHYFISLTDSIVIEWGATPEEKKQKGEWKKIVDDINANSLV